MDIADRTQQDMEAYETHRQVSNELEVQPTVCALRVGNRSSPGVAGALSAEMNGNENKKGKRDDEKADLWKSVSVGRDVEAKPKYPITVEVMGFADKKDIQISICFVAKTAYGLLDNIVTLPKKGCTSTLQRNQNTHQRTGILGGLMPQSPERKAEYDKAYGLAPNRRNVEPCAMQLVDS